MCGDAQDVVGCQGEAEPQRADDLPWRSAGRADCTLDVAAQRSVADADQRARWISAEALAAAEKKNRPCRGPRADDDA